MITPHIDDQTDGDLEHRANLALIDGYNVAPMFSLKATDPDDNAREEHVEFYLPDYSRHIPHDPAIIEDDCRYCGDPMLSVDLWAPPWRNPMCSDCLTDLDFTRENAANGSDDD